MTTAVVTGAKGFIGRHLVRALRESGVRVNEISRQSSAAELDGALADADVVYHLAAVNRPTDPAEFESVNVDLTRHVIDRLSALGRKPVFVLASSAQVEHGGTPYGNSKLAAERVVEGAAAAGMPVRIYRLPNVFGRGGRPMYNSVVATFCHFAARGQPLPIDKRESAVRLVHVDYVVSAFLLHLSDKGTKGLKRCEVAPTFDTTVGELADQISAFAASRRTLELPDFSDPYVARLYATYLSYLPTDAFGYALERRSDPRGVLAEFIKSPTAGQVFVSRTQPGVTRGNHWHSLKTEKFLVLDGDAMIRFRQVDDNPAETISYRVSGTDFRVLDIPPGYTHSIENIGKDELIVLFWASEIFDPARPDTNPLPVTDA